MNNAIEIKNIEQSFGQKRVLDGVSLSIGKGQIFGLLGPSGAGKTTLIKILTGQLKPTGGSAVTLGKTACELHGSDYDRIGMMMDSFGLYERMSCIENLRLFTKIYRVPKEKVRLALERVGLGGAAKTPALNLSKGMRNRLLLARAFMREPEVLFLDEPTSGLDPATTREIHALIREERERGTTVFLTTHNMTEAETLCDGIALLCDGKIVEQGEPKEICRRYNHQKTVRLHLRSGEDIELPHDEASAGKIAGYFADGSVETIHSAEPTLESVFMELTGRRFE